MDWTSQSLVVVCALGHLTGAMPPESEFTLVGLTALTMLFKAVSFLRGLDQFAHLVVVLEQNVDFPYEPVPLPVI